MCRTQSPRITKIGAALISDDLEPDAIYVDVDYVSAGSIRIYSPAVERHVPVRNRSTINGPDRITQGDIDDFAADETVSVAANCINRVGTD